MIHRALAVARVYLSNSRIERRHHLVGHPKLWRQERDFQFRFLRGAGLRPEHELIEIGCGTLRGGLPLIGYLEPGHYTGIDVRHVAIEQGLQELREAGLQTKQPTIICAPEISVLSLRRQVDFIWSFAVLLHLGDKQLDDVFAFAARHLKPGASFYANGTIGEHEQQRWFDFPVNWRSVDDYRRVGLAHDLEMEDLGTLGSLGRHNPIRPEEDETQRMFRFRRIAAVA